MENYIKWFFEEFLDMNFDEKELISIWLTKHKTYHSRYNYKSVFKIEEPKQMTIFDEELERVGC
ncbi:hypothetical protein [Mammaliicoccus vitulinus]|uniref:hypothetical protein n=1 Tax=Mammaliicoccus vitulinus TaxID=71237 RepID=UPI00248CDA65|nr:hypothetical protein [Mammaliicoccus vitulinus]